MTENEAQQKADKANLRWQNKLCPFFDRKCQNNCVAYISATTVPRDGGQGKNWLWGVIFPRCKRLK